MSDKKGESEAQTSDDKDETKSGESSGSAQAGVSAEVSPSAILKLNIDCFHEIFEWLHLYDLINLAQTCTRLQQVAGDFNRSNYVSKRVKGEKGGVQLEYRSLNIFSNYITKVYISGNRLNAYDFVGSNCKSLRQIRLEGVLPEGAVECIIKILKRIEVVDLSSCFFHEEFFDYFLKNCHRLKSLSVKRSERIRNKAVIIGSGNEWLLRKYPTLEHFELTELYELQGNELMTFFELNPNVRTFSTDSRSLWENRESLLTCDIQLDKLSIEFTSKEIADPIHHLLNKLYERGFYKRLHVYSTYIAQSQLDEMFSLPFASSLEMLHGSFIHIDIFLENLTTLGISYGPDIVNMDDLPRKLPNLERIYFYEASLDHVFPFIRFSSKLRAVKIFRLHSISHKSKRFLDVTEFNKERSKLAGAQKVTIYLDEYLMLLDKWTYKTSNKMVQLSRFEWFEWEELNAQFRHDHLVYN